MNVYDRVSEWEREREKLRRKAIAIYPLRLFHHLLAKCTVLAQLFSLFLLSPSLFFARCIHDVPYTNTRHILLWFVFLLLLQNKWSSSPSSSRYTSSVPSWSLSLRFRSCCALDFISTLCLFFHIYNNTIWFTWFTFIERMRTRVRSNNFHHFVWSTIIHTHTHKLHSFGALVCIVRLLFLSLSLTLILLFSLTNLMHRNCTHLFFLQHSWNNLK